jgi:hypothetical protein
VEDAPPPPPLPEPPPLEPEAFTTVKTASFDFTPASVIETVTGPGCEKVKRAAGSSRIAVVAALADEGRVGNE